jgi:hypothetical protein
MDNKLEGKEFVMEQENVTLDERFSQIRKILRVAEILDEVDPDGGNGRLMDRGISRFRFILE